MSLLTPDEAAKELAISVRQLKDLTDAGAVRWINIGLGEKRPTRRYEPADIEEFKKERSAKCRSISERAPRPTRTTSSMEVVDFLEIRRRLREEKRKPSNGSGR